MSIQSALVRLLTLFFKRCTSTIHYAKVIKDGNDPEVCQILNIGTVLKYAALNGTENDVHIITKPAVVSPSDLNIEIVGRSVVIEMWSRSDKVIESHIDTLCKSKHLIEIPKAVDFKIDGEVTAAPEVRKIVDSGSPDNRIDVVFMGDGYQANERDKFFSDISRLTKDMFEGVTFKSYLPLFNIWAIYVESVDSGIGYNGAKNTPFKLYRDRGQLRGVYTGNAAYARQICKLTGTNACDYPSLIGNDDYYGGLEGEFVISTKSVRTGTVVLRHEMGHNFVDVGEEYDNGSSYKGVNTANSLNSVGWKNWLSGPLKEEKVVYRLLEYPWHDLSKGSKTFTFTSDGTYKRWYILTSVTASGQRDSLEFLLDGKILSWESRGSDDREFYDWSGNSGFTAGQHTLTVRSKTTPTNKDIPRMIASVTLHEYGTESETHLDNNYVSAYPTWDTQRRKTFRPTNAGCLMRNMTHNTFCSVCKEGMWYQFLNRISLIDSVKVEANKVTVETLSLGSKRASGNQVVGERLDITWILNNQEQTQHKNKFTIDNPAKGNWSVTVKLVTPEIKSDPKNLTSDTKTFTI